MLGEGEKRNYQNKKINLMKLPARSLLLCWACIQLFARGVYGQPAVDARTLALVGAKIYPSPTAPAIEDGVVLIRGGKIVAVGSSKTITVSKKDSVLDCRGLTLTAAFWNCHVHFMEPKWLGADTMDAGRFDRQMRDMITSHGFAHVFDLAAFHISNVLPIRNRIGQGDVPGPIIYATGVPLVPPNGNPIYLEPLKLPAATDSQTVVTHIRHQIDSGADGIKIWTGSPTQYGIVYMPDDMARLITTTAHSRGKPVFAHPSSSKGVMVAVDNGVNILAHTTPDDGLPWSDEMISKMLRVHMALIPTLKLWKDALVQEGDTAWSHDKLILTAEQQLHAFDKSGGTILFGTDVGYIADYATGDEFTLLAASGLTWPRILDMLTTAPAQRFGLEKRTGQVIVGLDADIVLLKGDPAADVQALDKVELTILHGRVIYKRSQ
jgi:imidazolonepropionase-like amidohydrolase